MGATTVLHLGVPDEQRAGGKDASPRDLPQVLRSRVRTLRQLVRADPPMAATPCSLVPACDVAGVAKGCVFWMVHLEVSVQVDACLYMPVAATAATKPLYIVFAAHTGMTWFRFNVMESAGWHLQCARTRPTCAASHIPTYGFKPVMSGTAAVMQHPRKKIQQPQQA